MEINAKIVNELRQMTGAGMMDCKKALTETNGDLEKAVDYLRKKGIASAAKKADRATKEGYVGSYIHATGKIGVLVEINCETDFVAKTDDFKTMVKDIAMQIAAANPQYVKREDVDSSMVDKERALYREKMIAEGKPAERVDQIVEGMLDKKFYKETCLLEQVFIKDDKLSVKEYVNGYIAKLGENIQVRRFVRYELGE